MITKDILNAIIDDEVPISDRLTVVEKPKTPKKVNNKPRSKRGFVNLHYKNDEKVFREKALKIFSESQLTELLKLKDQRLKALHKRNESDKKEKSLLSNHALKFARENFNLLFKFQERFMVKLKSPLDNKNYKLTLHLSKTR